VQSVKHRQESSGSPKSVHRLFTTADAKIPLSVVQVKREPQYVVLCCACRAPSSATAQIRCAKLKIARQSGTSRSKTFRPRPKLRRKLLQRGHGHTHLQFPSLCLSPPLHKAQNRCNCCALLCKLWRNQYIRRQIPSPGRNRALFLGDETSGRPLRDGLNFVVFQKDIHRIPLHRMISKKKDADAAIGRPHLLYRSASEARFTAAAPRFHRGERRPASGDRYQARSKS
jgi:hypothetical protein